MCSDPDLNAKIALYPVSERDHVPYPVFVLVPSGIKPLKRQEDVLDIIEECKM